MKINKLPFVLILGIIVCFSTPFLYYKLADKTQTNKEQAVTLHTTMNTSSSMLYYRCVQDVVVKINTSETYEATATQVEDDLEQALQEQLNYIDLSQMQDLINNLNEDGKAIFGNEDFMTKLYSILSGNFKVLGDNPLQAIANLFFDSFVSMVPLMAAIVAVGVLSGMLNQVRAGTNGKGLGDIIHFVCYGLVLVLIISSVYKLLDQTSSTLGFIKNQIDAIFPVLLTLLTAVGGTVSVTVYQPAIGLLSGSILQIFHSILVPIFIFSFVFSIISNFSPTIKLEKFSAFLSSLFKWIVGSVFTIFIAFISIQGITAGSIDGVSVKTAKFAMKSYIPILGGYLADGFNVIVASSVLIKNAIGLSGLLILFATVLSPILNIAIFSLFLKLTASILEPLTDGRISNFLFGVSKSMSMLLTILIGVSFMFLILTSLVMCSANFV